MIQLVLFLQLYIIFPQVLPKPSPLQVDGEKGRRPHWNVGQTQGAILRMLEDRVEEANEEVPERDLQVSFYDGWPSLGLFLHGQRSMLHARHGGRGRLSAAQAHAEERALAR